MRTRTVAVSTLILSFVQVCALSGQQKPADPAASGLREYPVTFQQGVTAGKTRYLPNWVDLTRVKPLNSGGYRAQLGISADAVVVLFSGSLSGKQGLMVIPGTAKLLRSRDEIVFVVCGEGIMKSELQTAAAGLRNVRFMPLQPAGQVSELLAMADIHLLPQSPDAADLVLPSKLGGMLASGRPVIATCRAGTEISEIVSQCGLVVAPENSVQLAHAISTLADDPERRKSLGRRARTFAENNFERNAVLRTVFAPFEINDRQLAL